MTSGEYKKLMGPELSEYDYQYLLGDERQDTSSALYGMVRHWCQSMNYGVFGDPTDKGKKAMEIYERKVA